jgi:hypothetical protein
MSTIAAILAGTFVMWLATYGPVYLGVLPRRSVSLPASSAQHRGAMLMLGSLVVSTCAALLQITRGAETVNEAIYVGFLVGLVPAAALAGDGIRRGPVRRVIPAALILLCAPVVSSIAIVIVR